MLQRYLELGEFLSCVCPSKMFSLVAFFFFFPEDDTLPTNVSDTGYSNGMISSFLPMILRNSTTFTIDIQLFPSTHTAVYTTVVAQRVVTQTAPTRTGWHERRGELRESPRPRKDRTPGFRIATLAAPPAALTRQPAAAVKLESAAYRSAKDFLRIRRTHFARCWLRGKK